MPDSQTLRKILRSWWTRTAAVLALGYYVVWPVASNVIVHYPEYREHIPMMLRDFDQWRGTAKAPEPKKVEAPSAPRPLKKVEAPKPPQPCIAGASAMIDMLRAASGGGNYAPQFDVFLKGRETCFILKLTAEGDLRMKFATHTWFNLSPTYHVTPRDKADLQRYRPGDWLRIKGRLAKYVDMPGATPDEVYIEAATFNRIDADEIETGSIWR